MMVHLSDGHTASATDENVSVFLRFNFFFILVFRFVTVTAFSVTPARKSGRIQILYLEPEEYKRMIHIMCILSSVVYNIIYYYRHLLYSVNNDGGRRVASKRKNKNRISRAKTISAGLGH